MTGPIAQIVALTCYLNARRRGIVKGFFPENSTCASCRSIEFLKSQSDAEERLEDLPVVATSPDQWMDELCAANFSRAILVHMAQNDKKISDRMSVGFVGGGGRWILAAQQGELSSCWEALWRVENRDAPDRKIWRVRYIFVMQRPAVEPDQPPIAVLMTKLGSVLAAVEGFARGMKLEPFAMRFKAANDVLNAVAVPESLYCPDLAPEGLLNPEARRLLAACQTAWVFGGMGSWNDLSFEGDYQSLYTELSDQLYAVITQGLCAAANSTAKP